MTLSLLELLVWLQPAATGGGGSGGGGGAASSPQYCMMQGGLMLAVLAFTYFFMIRPEQKRREEADQLLKSLRKGMKVRTTGGILGEILQLDEHTVTLGIADKVRINVLRSHIAGPEPEKRDSASEAKDAKDDKAKEDKGAKKPEDGRG